MSESSKRHSKFLSLIFILKSLSKASVITNRLPNRYFPKTDLGAPVQFSANERRKYSKKTKSWNLWTSSWIRTENNPSTFRADHARSREWNLWLEIINIQRFEWISTVSRKVLTLLESALRHLEVLKFLWQLSTTSQDQSSEKGPVHTS